MNKRAALVFIFITIMIDSTGLGIIIPSLPNLVADTLNVSIEESSAYYGPVLASYALMQFLFAPLVGGIRDRFGRRPVLLMSLFGLGVDYVFMFFAPTLAWLIVGRCIAGMFGASFTTASAYMADISTEEDRTKNFGLIGAAFGVGFVLGPALGGFLADFGLRVPFLAAAILSLLNLTFGFFVCKESLAPENRRPFEWKRSNPIGSFFQIGKYKRLGILFAVFFLYYMAAMAIQSSWNYLTIEKFNWSLRDVGISLAVVGICIAFVQGGLTGRFSKAFGDRKTGLIGLTIFFLSLIGIGTAPYGWMLYALMVPYAFTGLAGPAIRSIMAANTAVNEQGELQGTLTSLMSLSEIIGPVIMMSLFTFTTVGLPEEEKVYGSPYLLAATFIFVGIILFLIGTNKLAAHKKQD
jgi:DHA1 family tetracycline resistance protein-like MFS transporter